MSQKNQTRKKLEHVKMSLYSHRFLNYVKCHNDYNKFDNILRLFDVLLNFVFTTSKMMCD